MKGPKRHLSQLNSHVSSAPPSARIEPERQTVAQGTEIEIRCIPSGSPVPSIQWSKVGGNLPPSVLVSVSALTGKMYNYHKITCNTINQIHNLDNH